MKKSIFMLPYRDNTGYHMTKIIFTATAGKLDFYLEDYASNLAACGNEVHFVPLATFNRKPFYRFWEGKETFKYRKLEECLSAEKADILICNFSTLRFDFAHIRSFFKGKIVLYDMEGPNFKAFEDPSCFREVDLVVTVSRIMAKILQEKGVNAVYIPHGVECSRFHTVSLAEKDEIFRRKAIFIGRPSPHRRELCRDLLANGCDLTLYGKRWQEEGPPFAAAAPIGENVTGEALLKAVSGAKFAVNILQDQFVEWKTLMNLQLFFYGALGCPLLTEFVEELPDCFEEGREMNFFRNREELLEKAEKMEKDPDTALMGQRAKERILKEHTLGHRAALFHKYLKGL